VSPAFSNATVVTVFVLGGAIGATLVWALVVSVREHETRAAIVSAALAIGAPLPYAAAGWLALGALVLLLVAFPIRRGERWARLAAPAALLIFYVPTLLATLSVLHETPASPPWRSNVVACLCAVVGLLLDAPWRSHQSNLR